MVILIWAMSLILFVFSAALLTALLANNISTKEVFHVLWNGFKEGLRGSGLIIRKRKYKVDLWVWETVEDEHVCEDCIDRAAWPPMDIADWMKEGLPGTPESDTECREKCRCKLVPYNPHKSRRRHHKN